MKRESIAGLAGGVAFLLTAAFADLGQLIRDIEGPMTFALAVAVGYGVFRVIAK